MEGQLTTKKFTCFVPCVGTLPAVMDMEITPFGVDLTSTEAFQRRLKWLESFRV